MDQETANALFEKGAFLLFLNVPEGMEFGIDYNLWQTGPKFKGVKLIPPGLHFAYCGASNKSATLGLRTGFFKYYEEKEVVIKEWDPVKEDLADDGKLDTEQCERMKSDMKEFDQFLGAYPLSPNTTYVKWRHLTNYITAWLLSRVLPKDGKVSNITSTVDEEEEFQSGSLANESASGSKYSEETIMFTKFDLKRSWRPGAVGPEVTKYSQDKSWLLVDLLKQSYRDDYKELLGELQLSFVCLLLAQNYAGFLQWKKLVQLLCGCCESLESYANTLFAEFLDVLKYQLEECPEDFFRDIISENNFLTHMLQMFRRNIADISTHNSLELRALNRKFENFRLFLNRRFEWELLGIDTEAEEVEEEFAPVVVELSEELESESASVMVELPENKQ